MNGLPSVSSLILYLFQFALAIFNPGAILLYLCFRNQYIWLCDIVFVLLMGLVLFIFGMGFTCYFVFLRFITNNMIIDFPLCFLFPSRYPVVLVQVLFRRCVIIQKDDNGFGLTGQWRQPSACSLSKKGKAFLKNSLVTGSKQSKNRKA